MDPAHDAIAAALNCDWDRAIELNKKILTLEPENVEALLRMAHASFESGSSDASLKYTKKVLSIDPDNNLAKRCLARCNTGKSASPVSKKTNLKAFLEVPGKTKSVRLVNLGEPRTLAGLVSGEPVCLTVSSHKVSVETSDGEHIGRLPDDVALKLAKKSAGLWAAIRSAEPTEVSILIHEK